MQQRSPPTPPSNELQYGLHHVARHNAQSPLQGDWRAATDGYSHNVQSPQDGFGSSGLIQQSADPFIGEPYGDDHYSSHPTSATIGLADAYSGYDTQQYINPPGAIPMTPPSDSSVGVRTRSGRSAARSDSPSILGSHSNARVAKSRPKKTKSKKAVSNKTPKLDAPLSELTKDMEVKTRDMVAWVNRSDEERHAETEKRNGYITRPMNAFMLYRSAYAERTKQWCLQNNHQVVSSVSGESWPMEPESVRDHFNNLAKIERENHARAHPNYKFSPSKTPATTKKKRNEESDEDQEDSWTDSGDPDSEWRPKNDRSGQGRSRRLVREADYPAAHGPTSNPAFEHLPYAFDQEFLNAYAWNGSGRVPSYGFDHYDQFDSQHAALTNHSDVNLQQQHHPYAISGFETILPSGMQNISPDMMFHSDAHTAGVGENQVDPSLYSNDHTGNIEYNMHGDSFKIEQEPAVNLWGDTLNPFGEDGWDQLHGSEQL
ncbi:MAG: hypothetical protein Q9162_005191 [Coniocarpon cinnabarinum]